MDSGDTLLIMDGIYDESITDMPSGSPGDYTEIFAANPQEVTIRGSGSRLSIVDKSYIEIKGFRFVVDAGALSGKT